MRKALAVLTLFASVAGAQAKEPTFKVEKFEVGGEGGHDYIYTETGTSRVFISRGTHVMVVDGNDGKVLGDIPNTPGVHGVAISVKAGHGFTTNGRDSSVVMFDTKTLAELKRIKVAQGGLDGIMYDEISDRIVLTNHSKTGTVTFINPTTGDVTGSVELEDNGPEGAAADDKGRVYINLEGKNAIQVVDTKTMKSVGTWPICDGPTGIAMDLRTNRIFSGCGKESNVVDAATGKVVAKIANGDGVDALAYDPVEHLIYIPAGRSGNVTVARMVGPNEYKVIATVATGTGTKTIAFDPRTHAVYCLALQYGPPPANAQPAPGGRPARGSVTGATLYKITH